MRAWPRCRSREAGRASDPAVLRSELERARSAPAHKFTRASSFNGLSALLRNFFCSSPFLKTSFRGPRSRLKNGQRGCTAEAYFVRHFHSLRFSQFRCPNPSAGGADSFVDRPLRASQEFKANFGDFGAPVTRCAEIKFVKPRTCCLGTFSAHRPSWAISLVPTYYMHNSILRKILSTSRRPRTHEAAGSDRRNWRQQVSPSLYKPRRRRRWTRTTDL